MKRHTPEPAALDCIIIGAGPAGLTAALYLARFRRRILVVDAGDSRAALIPITHNYPGFPNGVSGADLLQRLTDQGARYGVSIRRGTATALAMRGTEFVVAIDDDHLVASAVIIATGVVDNHPQIPGLREATLKDRVRWCPICDGFDVLDQEVAIIGSAQEGYEHALFLRTYTRRITLFVQPDAATNEASDAVREKAAAAGIRLIEKPVVQIDAIDDQGLVLRLGDGEELSFDTLYPMLGCRARTELANSLAVRVEDNGELVVDAHQQTSIPGLYAAGDVVRALNQMCVGTGHAAIAATAIHNYLQHNFR